MTARPTPIFDAGRWLFGAVIALAVFRLWFAAALPMTGDEAYFVTWGALPAGGYYDHPPMVGWWLAALLAVGRAEWWLRLPSVLLPFVLAWCAWWLVRQAEDRQGENRERALLAALLTLLQPADVWNVLITTDTPVVYLSLASVLVYVQAQRRASLPLHALAGLLLGMAFLGKYFAALLGFAYAAHFLLVRRDRSRWWHFAVLTAIALIGPAYNLWWNSSHCWVNILFNFFNRTSKTGFEWQNPLLFLAIVSYLATPWVLWALWQKRREVRAALNSDVLRASLWLGGVPLLIFFAMSFMRSVGLHWLLAFMPLLAVVAAGALPVVTLRKLVRWSAVFAVLHVVFVAVVMNLPISVWKQASIYPGVVFTWRAGVIEKQLREPLARCGEGCTLAMEGYSSAAILAYATGRQVSVFRDGSRFGRQDDFDTDMRALDGRDFVVLRKEPIEDEAYLPFFERVEYSSFELDGVTFNVIHAQGFKYPVYRERMLTRVKEHYYRFPAWLPQRGCPFTDRYFPEGGK